MTVLEVKSSHDKHLTHPKHHKVMMNEQVSLTYNRITTINNINASGGTRFKQDTQFHEKKYERSYSGFI